MNSQHSLNTLVIGLDGATFDLILPFIREGELPTLNYIMKNGAWCELESTFPPVTAAAWPSFMTGENPGKHGILKFTQTNSEGTRSESQEKSVTSRSFAGRTFLDVMKINGLRVGAVTIPVTYPPWDVNGIMISGFPCPDNNKIYSLSRDFNLNFETPLNFEAGYYKTASEEQILEDCLIRDKLRSDLSHDLLKRFEFECFIVVFGGIDRACHDYWKYHDSEFPGIDEVKREKFKDAILRNYRLADDELARFLRDYGDDAHLFIISDHGSGRSPFQAFNVNVWLRKKYLLAVKENRVFLREMARKTYKQVRALLTPEGQKSTGFLQKLHKSANTTKILGGQLSAIMDWSKTRAFYYPLVYPVDGIMLNLKGRQANGTVSPGSERENLVTEIIQSLLGYRDGETGAKVVMKAFRREELYSGPFTEQFPDIVYVLNQNYMGGNEIRGAEITSIPQFQLSRRSGLHSLNGIFIAHGPKIEPGRIDGAKIIDVAPTLLYCSGLPIPQSMDGRVISEIFKKEIIAKEPISYLKFEPREINESFLVDDREQKQMKEKLRSLGYID